MKIWKFTELYVCEVTFSSGVWNLRLTLCHGISVFVDIFRFVKGQKGHKAAGY
jgi:hypothetical protein